ncbi:hypothetical protein F5Y14DRAFT_449556 [Nemania sp. NC0429]|nr:hypothetical protein F5Y14DRAFT_449556 [Nemania sp. NC0429]
MSIPDGHMLHPKRFSNSIINSIVYGIRTPHHKAKYMGRLSIPQQLFGNYDSRARSGRGHSFMDAVLNQQERFRSPVDQLRFTGGVLTEGGSDTSSTLILPAILQELTQALRD